MMKVLVRTHTHTHVLKGVTPAHPHTRIAQPLPGRASLSFLDDLPILGPEWVAAPIQLPESCPKEPKRGSRCQILEI
jgi:hypothetical protein